MVFATWLKDVGAFSFFPTGNRKRPKVFFVSPTIRLLFEIS